MIKLGFKLFGCATVVIFFFVAGIYIAASTSPPVYSVRKEISENVYPTAREHLIENFHYFMDQTNEAVDIGVFKASEIELNAYLYMWATQHFTPGGIILIKNPYLFVEQGVLKLRFDIAAKNLIQLLSGRFAGKELDENMKKLTESDSGHGNISITVVMKVFWVEKKDVPYFYIDRFYIGVLPIPIPIMLTDYQDQFNRMLEDALFSFLNFFPVYVRKIEVSDKEIKFETELKVTDAAAIKKKMREFNSKNPDVARALDSRNCLYGCTQEETAKLKEWMSKINKRSANEVTPEEVLFSRSVNKKITERRLEQINFRNMGTYWEKERRKDPDRDWGFKNFPDPEKFD